MTLTLAEIIRRRRIQAYMQREDSRVHAVFDSGQQCPKIRMEISPWTIDELGNRTRTIRAVEVAE